MQGTTGTNEEAIRYGWNCAKLLADGPSATSPLLVVPSSGLQSGLVVTACSTFQRAAAEETDLLEPGLNQVLDHRVGIGLIAQELSAGEGIAPNAKSDSVSIRRMHQRQETAVVVG